MPDDANFLREQANRCRRLAELETEPDLVKSLLALAMEYDVRADELERGPEQNWR